MTLFNDVIAQCRPEDVPHPGLRRAAEHLVSLVDPASSRRVLRIALRDAARA